MYSHKENVFIAKKMLSEMIYNSAYVEGCDATFSQTQVILDGMVDNIVKMDDIQTVINLRDAWRFVLGHLDDEIDLDFICEVNDHISRNESPDWGVLRYGNVGVSGTDYRPAIPDKADVIAELTKLSNINDPLEYASEYFCWATRAQLFWDGNKRTSTIVANAILIKHGAGVFTIDEKTANEFNKRLLHLYNTDEKESLKDYIRSQVQSMSAKFSFDHADNQSQAAKQQDH